MSRVCLAQYSLFFFLIVVLVAHHAPAGCVAEHAGSHPATAIQENARHGYDHLETSRHLPHLANILQLPRHGLLRQRG